MILVKTGKGFQFYYTQTDVCVALGTTPSAVHHRTRRGTFPAPTLLVGKRRYYSEDDFKQLTGGKTAKKGRK